VDASLTLIELALPSGLNASSEHFCVDSPFTSKYLR